MMKNRNKWLCVLAFAIPVVLMVLIYALTGIYPFGEKSILTIDMNNQYISYFSYYRNILQGEHGFLYTFSKIMGGDMVGLAGYYLLSPLNLILVFFSTEWLPVGITIMTLIKIGLCGLTFYCAIGDSRNTGKELIFSTSYALMTYNLVYQQNIMWLDGVILLPLVSWGIHKIVAGKSPFPYLFSLFFAVLFNYYIGYMICLFSVLYFLYTFFFKESRIPLWNWKILGSYALSSLLAGGLSMWMVIPVLRSLSGIKSGFSLSALTLTPNFHWSEVFVKLLPGSFDFDQAVSGLPNIYCGIFALVFVAVFFLNREMAIRQKVGAACVLGFFYLSFYLYGWNLIWHGFNEPQWFPYRYSFLFCFFLLLIAREGFLGSQTMNRRPLLITDGVTAVGYGLLIWYMHRKPFAFMSMTKYVISIVLMLLFLVLYLFYAKCKKEWIVGLMLLLCCGELVLNGKYMLENFTYADFSSYQDFVAENEPAVEYVKAKDTSFYRMEKTYVRKQCDPMLLDYNGLSHYSSSEKSQVKYFMGQMGFRNNGNWAYYNRGSTYAMDSLLGVKYILSKKEMEEPYQLFGSMGDTQIYENPYALPLGFMSSDEILTYDVTSPEKFTVQNDMWKALTGQKQDIFVEESNVEMTMKNLEGPNADAFYVKKDADKKASLTFTFKASSDNPVFAYFATGEMHQVTVKVNGKSKGKYFTTMQYDILRLGTFKKGEEVQVRLLLDEELVNMGAAWFYYQDMDVMDRYYDKLASGGLQITSYQDSHIIGTIENNEEGAYAFFSIPYEDGWSLYVDGNETETICVADTFLAAEIATGTHEIELKYRPDGYELGMLLSCSSATALLLWGILRLISRRKNFGEI